MALRLANKINRQLVQNVCRSLSAKREIPELESVVQKVDEASQPAEASSPLPFSSINSIATKYEVCRPRTLPVSPFPQKVQNETDVAKKTVAMQHLQPAMLPEYYKPPVEINATCMNLDPITETERQSTMKNRKFEDSKTCANVVLPLRVPKLASPFPDPVKVMYSHTISDQEKAEQMLAEARIVKDRSDNPIQQKSVRYTPPSRHYSTNTGDNSQGGKKCKIGEKVERKKCVHMKLAGCRPVKTISCTKKKTPRPQCTKKASPYPSYSETCHEEPYQKPSECKICPYKPDDHPFFKPPKSQFHTLTVLSKKYKGVNKGECDRPAAQKQESQESSHDKKKTKVKTKHHPPTKGKKIPPKKAQAILNEVSVSQIPSVEITSGDTKSKMKYTFFSTQAKENQDQEEAQNSQANVQVSANQAVSESMLFTIVPKNVLFLDKVGKCTKFPFKECPFEIVKKRKVTPYKHGKCPPKERPKLVKDCPPEDEDTCKRRTSPLKNYMELCKYSDNNNSKRKCPKVNLGICKNPDDYPDDPCKRKKRGETLICPDDLLRKKPKPKKKKTSPIVPLPEVPSTTKSETSIYT